LRWIPNPAALSAIEEALQLGWLAVRNIPEGVPLQLLSAQLHPGEAEAIVLALDISADWILLDETDGRAVAARAGLRVTGILGILLRAKQRGEIPYLRPELDSLRTRARFFVGSRLEQEVLRSAGE
jgi:predicted nucleic acid-binding protein